MKRASKNLAAGLAAALGLATAPFALADTDAGAHEYNRYCVACHGPEGRGDGPIAGVLNVPVSDLTKIASRRGGEFPMLEVLKIIDGRTELGSHGYPMPVWGDRFMLEAGDDDDTHEADLITLGRMLSLAYYLESIQE